MPSNIVVEGGLGLRVIPGKGRGVVALRRYAPLEPLLTNPVLVFEATSVEAFESTPLTHYLFHWPFGPQGEEIGTTSSHAAVAFGLISLINHQVQQKANATWVCNAADMTISAFALQEIQPEEEVVWDYWGGIPASD